MKIRKGFVSNSSSSSFLLIGSPRIDVTEMQKENELNDLKADLVEVTWQWQYSDLEDDDPDKNLSFDEYVDKRWELFKNEFKDHIDSDCLILHRDVEYHDSSAVEFICSQFGISIFSADDYLY